MSSTKFSTRLVQATVALALLTVTPTHAATKAPATLDIQTFTLKDFVGQDWKHDLVTYTLDKPLPAKDFGAVTLTGPDGKDVPFQLTAAGAKTKLSFFADLPSYGESSYHFLKRKPKTATAAFQIEEKTDSFRISNGLTGVDISTAAGNYKDGPLRAIRMKSGAWIGAGALKTKRAIESYTVTVPRQGDVFTDIECRYKFAGGKSWAVDLRLIAGEPVVLINETVDLDDDSVWQFVANKNFPINQGLGHVSEDVRISTVPLPYDDSVTYQVCPWVPWWNRKNTKFVGLFHLAEGSTLARDETAGRLALAPAVPAAGTAGDDMLIAAAGHVAAWARGGPDIYDNGLNKFIAVTGGKDGALTLQMPLDAPGRSWMLGTASVGAALVADGEVTPAQKLMNRFCATPLNEVKDVTLRWKRTAGFPRLVVKPEDVKRVVAAADFQQKIASNPATTQFKSVILPLIAAAAKTDAAHGNSAQVDEIKAGLFKKMDVMMEFFRYGNGGHNASMFGVIVTRQNVFDVLLPLDLALGAGVFNDAEQERIFAQLAFVSEKVQGPDFQSPGRSLTGNPNMVTAWCASRVLLACMMPDHPHAKDWYNDAMGRMDVMLDKWQGPTGAWLEAPHYMMVALDPIIIAKIASANAGFTDGKLDERILRTITFLAKLSTPRDSRFVDCRHYPPLGNTYQNETTSVFGAVAKLFKTQDPEKAAALQWMWLQMGKPHRAGLGGDFMMNFYHELMTDDTWDPPAPAWSSENIPGFGAVLRAGFNTDRETYMVYHQGDVSTSHYDYDQGSFEMWGKGRPLSLDWGYHGQAPAWQHNDMEIGTAGRVVNFADTPAADYLQGQQDGGWGRQVVLVKDKDPLGPTYFVLRETTTGTGAAGWWLWINTRKDNAVPPAASPIGAGPDSVPLAATGPGKPIEIVGDQIHAVGEQDVDLDVWFGPPSADRLRNLEVKELTISVPMGLPNGEWTSWDDGKATQQGLHLQQPLGQPLVSVLYPRLHTEAPAQFTALADGKVTKVVTPQGTDYIFLATEPFTFQDGPVSFSGTVGVIQVRGAAVTCTLNAAGDVTYGKAHLVAAKAQSQQFDAY